ERFGLVRGMSVRATVQRSVIQVSPEDDIAVALRPIAAGEAVEIGRLQLTAASPIPKGHKIALRQIRQGESVRKYGWPFGKALREIAPGEHVHTHNVATRLEGVEDYAFQSVASFAPHASIGPTFQ